MPCAKYDDDQHTNISDLASDTDTLNYTDTVMYNRDVYPTTLYHKIVNASTGEKYPYNQGSYDELRLYKMVDARGVYDEHGCKIAKHLPPNSSPVFLYYDSPEQCMRHQGIKLDKDRVNKWYKEKQLLFNQNGSFNKNEWEKLKYDTYKQKNKQKN